jgi:hypothetical protein
MVLPDPLTITGVFTLGAAAGSIIDYARHRNLINEYRKALHLSAVNLSPRELYDQQTCYRLPVELPVSVRRGSGVLLHCTTINISKGGMAVSGACSLDAGERLKIVFTIPDSDLLVSAEGTVGMTNMARLGFASSVRVLLRRNGFSTGSGINSSPGSMVMNADLSHVPEA